MLISRMSFNSGIAVFYFACFFYFILCEKYLSLCRYNKQIYYKQKEVADLNIAICDDESIIREQIKNLIEKQGES